MRGGLSTGVRNGKGHHNCPNCKHRKPCDPCAKAIALRRRMVISREGYVDSEPNPPFRPVLKSYDDDEKTLSEWARA